MSVTDLLLALQREDSALDRLAHRRANHPERARLAELERAAAGLRRRRDEHVAAAQELAAAQARLDAALAQDLAKRTNLQGKLDRTSVPREAEALGAELQALAAHTAALEDEILDVMERAEGLTAEVAALDGELAALDGDLAAAREALAAAERELDGEVAVHRAARDTARAAVPDDLAERYERLRGKYAGVAVAELQGATCSGCHLTLPTGEVQAVRAAGPDALPECPECGRWLVVARRDAAS